jgi:hypothetical protein
MSSLPQLKIAPSPKKNHPMNEKHAIATIILNKNLIYNFIT